MPQSPTSPQHLPWRLKETPPTPLPPAALPLALPVFCRTFVLVQNLLANSSCPESDSVLHLKRKFLLLLLHRCWLSQGCSSHTARVETVLLAGDFSENRSPWRSQTPGATSRLTACLCGAPSDTGLATDLGTGVISFPGEDFPEFHYTSSCYLFFTVS